MKLHPKIKKKLDKEDPNKVRAAASNIKKFMTMYNRLCRKCKLMVIKKPKTDLSGYCYDCQNMMRDVWNEKKN